MQRGNATFRQDIADVLQENMLGAGQFAGMQIMPLLPVEARSGEFAKIAFASVKTKAVDDKRGSTGNYNEVTHEVGSDNYTTKKRGLIEPVDDDDAVVLGSYFDAEVSAAEHLQYYLQLNREKRIADIAFSTSVMSSYTAAVSTKWSTVATCTPVVDVETAKEAITLNLNGLVGATSRVIGVGNLTARKYLRGSTDIKGRVYGGGNIQSAQITDEQLAEQLGLDAVYFSGLKQAGSSIWNATRFGVYVVSESSSLRSVPHFGRTFLWKGSTPSDMMVESYRDEDRESDVVRVKHHTVEKYLTLRAGYLLTNIT